MPQKPPKPADTYNEIAGLLAEIREAAKFDTRISLIDQRLVQFKENYVKETDIHKMISARIKKYDNDREKIDKNGIQWGAIIQQVAIAGISCLLTYFLVKGAMG